MKTLLVLTAIIAVVVCRQALSGAERAHMVDLFRALQKSEIGQSIFTTIELELSSTKQENIIDKIIGQLQSMLDDSQDQKDKAIQELGQKQAGCDVKQSELEGEINSLKDRIAQADLTFPTLSGQIDSKKTQLESKQREVNDANDRILALDEQASEGKKKFEAAKVEHNNMIDALREAKKLISQLSAQKGAFLQQSSTIMTQIEQHFDNAPKNLMKKHNKGLLAVLLSMAKDVGIQADQKQVTEILAIIDDLIAYEQKTMRIEFDAEQRRLSRYDFDRKRLQQQNEFFDAEIKDLQATLKTLETRYKELQSDLTSWKQQIKAKQTQSEDTDKVCRNAIDFLEKRKVDLTENFDIIRQVIVLFKSKSIQDIREVVSDLKA